ncbi:MAG: histidine kinase [Bacteroidia bacterium]|nr:histidine kinase [Bacteroidia bacterium]
MTGILAKEKHHWIAWMWVLPLFPGILLGLLILPSPTEHFHWVGWAWLMVVLSLLILSNQLLHRWFNRLLPWGDAPQRRFFTQLIASLAMSLVLMNLSYLLFQKIGMQTTPDADQVYVLNVYGLIFLLPLISAQVVSYIFALWKKSALLSEKLQQENIQTRLESLRSHLDPHFLFNSLNILSSLIDKSQDDAQEFLGSFSDVYRYVLKNKQESVVPLRTEWAFLESYLHLIQMRFSEQMVIELSAPDDMNAWALPPLALQMLVENAIKHNKASERQPLHLEIFAEKDVLVVKNNRRPNPKKENSHGSGLANLKSRYAYLTERPLEVIETEEHFVVRLPMLQKTDK